MTTGLTMASASVSVDPGTTTKLATENITGGDGVARHHQVMIQADHRGNLLGTNPKWIIHIPAQTVGADLDYFDIYNPTGSNKVYQVNSCIAMPTGAYAVTGVLGVDLWLHRTTSEGTGGTALVFTGTSHTAAPSCNRIDTSGKQLSTSYLTGRKTPTGGAATGSIMGMVSVFTEETAAGTYQGNNCEMVMAGAAPVIREGYGFKVQQGSVASVGAIGFIIVLECIINSGTTTDWG